ncbi:alkaline phosphatase family protein [Paludibaculum fermentans]|uniref:alkaline phosphatase family protein n=1 Tax=Paludibaculum fermentans TaxID=1473598 RepID=UPI003EC0CA7B
MKTAILALLGSLSLLAAERQRPELVIVLVIDGLRPDSITPAVMPNLDRLKSAGVWYTQAHSVFPTVTRVNTTSISTGMLPARHGIASNSLYLPSIAPTVLSNGDYRNLLHWGEANGGRVVGPKSLHEYLQAASMNYVAVSSGSTGNALLLNPTAPYGNGQLINGGFEDGRRVAFPDSLNTALLDKFGAVKGGEDGDQALLWIERVLREYVLGTLHPQVIVDWMGRSDSAQHSHGVGSPQGLAALRLIDGQIGLLLQRLRQLNLEDKTDILVTCDHGFDYEPRADLLAPLRDSGFAADIVTDNEGGSTLFYVKNHDAQKIASLVKKFQATATTNAIFVPAKRPAGGAFRCAPGAVKGFLPGTFALDLAAQCSPARGPDVIVTHRWSADPNPFGVPGTQWIPGKPGQPPHHGHGGLNPYVTHSTLLAVGPDFAQGKVVELPAGNQDIAPTVLALQGVAQPQPMDGRVLSEAFRKSAKPPAKAAKRRIQASIGDYCAELEVSYAGHSSYLTQAQRCAPRK